MIVDTSAIVAIAADESESDQFLALLRSTPSRMSAATYLEAGIVLDSRRNPDMTHIFDRLVERMRIDIVPVTEAQSRIARQAYRDYGRGSGHRAQLNFGDCFPFALAMETNEPLLYKGDDFAHTGIRAAAPRP